MMQRIGSSNLEAVCSYLGLMQDVVIEVSQQVPRYYVQFERPKRAGGVRIISASNGRLKAFQRTILDALLAPFPMPPHIHGCVRGRSVATNARIHQGCDVVINIDLRNFFGSIGFDRVKQIFAETFSFDDEAADVFTRLTVLGDKLPQGAPTSPALANLAGLKLDTDVIATCTKGVGSNKFNYSRYVDDITISGGKELVELIPKFYEAIEENGFSANLEKTKILRRSARQSVTGLVVNKEVSVPKTLIRKVRQQLYYCLKWGLPEHCETRGLKQQQFVKSLRGMIAFIRISKPDLAMEFNVKLHEIEKELKTTTKEDTLKALKHMIDHSQVASFRYKGEDHRAAPAAITLDPEDTLLVRAFQIEPEEGWRYFEIEKIRALSTD